MKVFITYPKRKQYDSALAILGRMWAGTLELIPGAGPLDVYQFITDCADHKVIV